MTALFGQREVTVPYFEHISVVVVPRHTVWGPLVICVRVRKDAVPHCPNITARTPQVADRGNPCHLRNRVSAVDLERFVAIIIDRFLGAVGCCKGILHHKVLGVGLNVGLAAVVILEVCQQTVSITTTKK
jgi:hypothetical protein